MNLREFAEYVTEKMKESRPFIAYWHACGYGLFYLDGGKRAELRFRRCLKEMWTDKRIKDLKVVEAHANGAFSTEERGDANLAGMLWEMCT